MPGLEVAAISLGAAVARAACGVWLGDHRIAAEVGASVIDQAAERLTSARERRRFHRIWDEAAELVAERILALREPRDLPPNEREAAIHAVRETFEAARLTEDDLFKQDLDAGYLDRYLRAQDPGRAERAGLAEGAVRLYDLVLRECAAYAIEAVHALPGAGLAGITELLRRDRQILDDIRAVLERLPERRGLHDFERDYRQLVANRLDQVEFFGVTLSESSRRYPLSVAYLSLTARAARAPGDLLGADQVERVLARSDRLFVRGQAGTGKTTLLHWIAVHSARGSFPERLTAWNGTVPFFLPLRRYAAAELPAPEAFLQEVGRHIAQEMAPGWVQRQLRSGRAIVLLDGVDELAEERRDEVKRWLTDLITAFPRARYVVTSRPAAAPEEWLAAAGFLAAELEPMTPTQVRAFAHRWHEAIRSGCTTEPERAEVTEQEERLLDALDHHRHLRQLAGYPLLCALLCALHRDRRGQLPGNRMELYEIALHMLLERRDRERRIDTQPVIGRTEQTLLLSDLAYWLIRNGWSDAARADAIDRLAAKLRAMPQVKAEPAQVYRVLLERTGLLREQVEGRVDFVHRSFEEYLAAKQAVDEGDFGVLRAHAHESQWHEVVVMAAGHASAAGREALLGGLLARARERDVPRTHRDLLGLVALACLETSPERSPALERSIREATAKLVPPQGEAAARALGRAGPFAIDLLMASEPNNEYAAVLTIEAVRESGDPAALPLLARFGGDSRHSVVDALVRAWPHFDPEEYAARVLADSPLHAGELTVDDPSLLPALRWLRRLTHLTAAVSGPGGLGFVRDLPALRALEVAASPGPLDLAPLAGRAKLGALVVAGDVTSVRVLTELPLRELALGAPSFYQLGGAELPALKSLTLYQVTTVEPLGTVGLPGVARLDLHLADGWTAEAFPVLPGLRRLAVHFATPPDLGALRELTGPVLAIHHHGRGPLDLSLLAGRANVRVHLYRRSAEVVGEAGLGPGSLVRSAWEDGVTSR
ncbi:NACHT domain-containing protein [Phytohabitans sp. ZYX-F-186]|uniref:NACHT domain-containing protein n=1 Tax=Phytohabitans maris TaxID=3071409 RepID=A0ABU0ZJW0_9ACTN|nr:NACHT domain-containing protein [Phytohabitans sp. ZYX-F-186]MDQ7907333.1 NACHT domain-containing protein [Phytohabitans sp. ZYX-F-186]